MKNKNKIIAWLNVLSYLLVGAFLLMIIMLVSKSINVVAGVVILVVSGIASLVCAMLAKAYKDGFLPREKKEVTKYKKPKPSPEEKERAKLNEQKLKSFAKMPFIERFKGFLEALGIDHTKYATETFITKDKRKLTLYDINLANIRDFAWAKFLAEKHELILINNKQETLESLSEFEKYKNGFLSKYLKENKLGQLGYYRDDIKRNDYERLEYAKDISYFIRDICGAISCYKSSLNPIYIETDDPNTFLFGIYNNPKRQGIDYFSTKSLRYLAESIGLYAFPVSLSFPKTLRKTLDHSDCDGEGVVANKNYKLETRNDKLIAELKEKKEVARAEALKKFLSKEEPPVQTNDNFVPIVSGFKSGDEVECYVFGEKLKVVVSSVNKDDGEFLDKDELDEVNWLITSNIMDNKEIQFKVLERINERYDMALGGGVSHKTKIKREFNITAILIDIQKGESNDPQDVDKIIAFCGEAGCDVEHGLSVSFVNRKFAGVNSYMDFNYIEADNA